MLRPFTCSYYLCFLSKNQEAKKNNPFNIAQFSKADRFLDRERERLPANYRGKEVPIHFIKGYFIKRKTVFLMK